MSDNIFKDNIICRGGRTGRKLHQSSKGSSVLFCGHWLKANAIHFKVADYSSEKVLQLREEGYSLCEKCFRPETLAHWESKAAKAAEPAPEPVEEPKAEYSLTVQADRQVRIVEFRFHSGSVKLAKVEIEQRGGSEVWTVFFRNTKPQSWREVDSTFAIERARDAVQIADRKAKDKVHHADALELVEGRDY